MAFVVPVLYYPALSLSIFSERRFPCDLCVWAADYYACKDDELLLMGDKERSNSHVFIHTYYASKGHKMRDVHCHNAHVPLNVTFETVWPKASSVGEGCQRCSLCNVCSNRSVLFFVGRVSVCLRP